MNRRVVLWRHGRTAWNAEHRFQGQSDVPLDELGIAQAKAAARTLATMKPSRIASSDLQRALVTAQALADAVGLPVEVDEGLRETYAGDWQGLTRDEIMTRWPEDFHAWGGDSDLRPGGGETRLEVAERVLAAIHRQLEHVPDGGTLVIASHGGALRAAMARLMGLAPSQWSALGVLSNAQWSVLTEIDPAVPRPPDLHWRLHEYNAGSITDVAVGDDR